MCVILQNCRQLPIYSLNLTESTINHAVTKIVKAFGPIYQEMISELKKEANIHGDETSWRLNGKNYWLWTFVGKLVAIYEIDPTRSKDVPKRIIGGFKGNVTSDSYSAWNYVGKTHQRCHIHYIREIKDTYNTRIPEKNSHHLQHA